MTGEKFDRHFETYIRRAEIGIYSLVAVLLAVTALATVASAGWHLWNGLIHLTMAGETFSILDQILLVLMLLEILHTVRISAHSNILLVIEPFLVVGLIATIRRLLVISLEMAAFTKTGELSPQGLSAFHAALIELGLLVILVVSLVFSITLLRRSTPATDAATGTAIDKGHPNTAARLAL